MTSDSLLAEWKEILGIEASGELYANTIPDKTKSNSQLLYHKNFMHYLALAWENHFSVFISPDIGLFLYLS